MRTTLVLHRRTSEKVADLRAPSGAGVHGDEVLQPLGPVARLLEELSTGRPLGLLVRIDPAAGQLQREGAQGLPPLAHEHHVSPVRERYHGGESTALQDTVLDPCLIRQLHLVHAKCAPRIAKQILPSERPPTLFCHAEKYIAALGRPGPSQRRAGQRVSWSANQHFSSLGTWGRFL